MSAFPETPEGQKAQAHQDLEDIGELRRSKPFARYFIAEPKRRIEEIQRKLRDRKLTEADRQYHLGELATFERWQKKLDEDEQANHSIVKA